MIVLAVVIIGILAPWITPFDPFKLNIPDKLQAPNWTHWLGTDNIGRDILSRVILGTRIALIVGVSTVAIALAIGLALGLAAGYGPRWLDYVLVLIFDVLYSFPTVMLALTAATLFEPSLTTLMWIIVVIQTPGYARLTRTATLTRKNSEYIDAIRSLGASPLRVVGIHVLPNIIGPLFIIASMDIPSIITLEAGLTLLGMGIPPPAPSWGRTILDGFLQIREAPWIVISGSIPLIITTLGFTFLGEALRDLIDPKLRRIV